MVEKSPAASARSLILHVRDVISRRPVNRVGSLDILESIDHASALSARGRLGKVQLLELLKSQVRELVVSKRVRAVATVVLLDDMRVLGVNSKTLIELLAALDLNVVLGNMVHEISGEAVGAGSGEEAER